MKRLINQDSSIKDQTDDVIHILEENEKYITHHIKEELKHKLSKREEYKGFKKIKFESHLLGCCLDIIRNMYGNINAENRLIIECDLKVIKLTDKIIKNVLGEK